MVYPLTITSSAMRAINRSAILEIIRRESPISRTAIAEHLHVSLPTVMRIVDELVEEGLVRSEGSTEWSGGRRRPLLEFNRNGFVVLGVDLGGLKIYGAISDLGGNILDEMDMGRHGSSAEENYDRLIRLIDTLLSSPKIDGRKVHGIGIGVPGVTLHKDGIVKWAFSLKWRDFPLKDRLSEKYALPITVDNDVNLAAMGELWFGAGQDVENMILMVVGYGIGAGIIIDRALYRGANEASGEVGNFLPGREFLNQDYRDFGALENVASGIGIVERARASLRSRRDPAELEVMTADEIFMAAHQNHKWAKSIVDEMVDYLAIAIANLTVSFDPELIVLSGSITPFAGELVGPILQRIKNAIPMSPKLVVSSLGQRAGAMGAVTNVLHKTTDFYQVRKLS